MSKEIDWQVILDSLSQLLAEHGKKIKALETIFKKLFKRIMKDKYTKSDLDSDLALIIKNELKQFEG